MSKEVRSRRSRRRHRISANKGEESPTKRNNLFSTTESNISGNTKNSKDSKTTKECKNTKHSKVFKNSKTSKESKNTKGCEDHRISTTSKNHENPISKTSKVFKNSEKNIYPKKNPPTDMTKIKVTKAANKNNTVAHVIKGSSEKLKKSLTDKINEFSSPKDTLKMQADPNTTSKRKCLFTSEHSVCLASTTRNKLSMNVIEKVSSKSDINVIVASKTQGADGSYGQETSSKSDIKMAYSKVLAISETKRNDQGSSAIKSLTYTKSIIYINKSAPKEAHSRQSTKKKDIDTNIQPTKPSSAPIYRYTEAQMRAFNPDITKVQHQRISNPIANAKKVHIKKCSPNALSVCSNLCEVCVERLYDRSTINKERYMGFDSDYVTCNDFTNYGSGSDSIINDPARNSDLWDNGIWNDDITHLPINYNIMNEFTPNYLLPNYNNTISGHKINEEYFGYLPPYYDFNVLKDAIIYPLWNYVNKFHSKRTDTFKTSDKDFAPFESNNELPTYKNIAYLDNADTGYDFLDTSKYTRPKFKIDNRGIYSSFPNNYKLHKNKFLPSLSDYQANISPDDKDVLFKYDIIHPSEYGRVTLDIGYVYMMNEMARSIGTHVYGYMICPITPMMLSPNNNDQIGKTKRVGSKYFKVRWVERKKRNDLNSVEECLPKFRTVGIQTGSVAPAIIDLTSYTKRLNMKLLNNWVLEESILNLRNIAPYPCAYRKRRIELTKHLLYLKNAVSNCLEDLDSMLYNDDDICPHVDSSLYN